MYTMLRHYRGIFGTNFKYTDTRSKIEVVSLLITPDIQVLPFHYVNGIKYFELFAEPVKREILPGLFIQAWGYNGTTPGPTIQVYSGDYVSIRVHNRLEEATSIHWHGLDIPNMMDGVTDVEPSPSIEPGKFLDYRFRVSNPPGTHMYHTHANTARQEMMGLGGAFIIMDPNEYGIDRDYFLMLQEFKVKDLKMGEIGQGTFEIDAVSHDFNFFTINGRCFPFTSPMPVSYGDIVRIRLGNIVHDAHPMHIHGHQFAVVATDGNILVSSQRYLKNTLNVASGETYDVVFKANNQGVWPFHCHIPHHMSNNMSQSMGGMFTTIVYQ